MVQLLAAMDFCYTGAMDPIHKLTELFREFPGIGPRQAKRFVYFLLTKNHSYIDELSRLFGEIQKSVRSCAKCYRFFPYGNSSGLVKDGNDTGTHLCSICRDSGRDRSTLMIISRDVDLETVEKSRVYNGHYFVLGGNVPILDKNPEERVRVRELGKRLADEAGTLKEIILSLNANAEGEHTSDYIRHMVAPHISKHSIKVSVLGRGLSTGAELEYSDSETIKNALKNRA
jgi:recombination protein RecR